MLTEIDVLRDVVSKLNSVDIAYMLTGSLAMSYYAVPRMTRDIDIVVFMKETDCRPVLNKFSNEYYVSDDAVMMALKNKSMFNIIHNESVIKVDLIVMKGDEYSRVAFSRKNICKIAKFDVSVISKEDLILSKLIWYRDSDSERQLKDIRNLVSTGYDEAYVNEWLEKLKLNSCFSRVQTDA